MTIENTSDHNLNKNTTSNFYEKDQIAKSHIFQIKKKIRRSDKIGGKIWALFIIFTSIIAIARLTVIGQFLDDVLLNFIFGWFKYVIYFCIILISFCIFLGMQIKVKLRAKMMIIGAIIFISWILNDVVLLINHQAAFTFSKNWFLQLIISYSTNWYANSIFISQLDIKQFFHINGTYFASLAGGGFLGTLFSGVFGYLTTYFSLVLSGLLTLSYILWVLTGNMWFIFQWKTKKTQKGLKVVKIIDKEERASTKKVKNKKKHHEPHFEKINLQGLNISDRQVLHSSKDSDITIRMPSFALKKIMDNEDLLFDDIYEQSRKNSLSTNWKEPRINIDQQNINHLRTSNYQPLRTTIKEESQEQTSMLDLNAIRESFNEGTYITPFDRMRNQNLNKKQPEQVVQEHYEPFRKTQTIEIDSTNLLDEVFLHENVSRKNATIVVNNEIKTNFIEEMHHLSAEAIPLPVANDYVHSVINPNYQLPPLSLLHKPTIGANRDLNVKTATENVRKIHRLFHQFNIDAKVTNINIGPTVTKFEIEPGMGVKVSKITTLENDIKLILASKEIRLEAPIHGKSAVGIEIPNISPALVTLREIMEHVPENKADSKLLMAIGKNVMGKILFAELDKMPHLLIAGATGSGKSICINSIIASLLLRVKPHEVKFLLIDPKRVELSVYNDLPHLLVPVITDLKKANRALKQIISEMERRYLILSDLGVRNIATYNSKVSFEERLPYIVIIIDELADLMVVAGKDVEESIMRITQMARAAGIHLIIATQRPSTDIITGVIKNNIPSRIAFAVSSSIDSRTILDSMGAERLIGSGDMLFAPYGQITPTRAQGVFIGDDEINDLIKFITRQQKAQFNEIMIAQTQNNGFSSHIMTGEDDELYEEIKDFVISHQKASASLLQRRFGIGYNRAARMVDSLEANGVVGQQNGSKPREVLIKK